LQNFQNPDQSWCNRAWCNNRQTVSTAHLHGMLRAQRSYRTGRVQGWHAAAEAHGRISASSRGGPTAAHASRSPPHPASAVIHQHLQGGWTHRVLCFRHRWHVNGYVNSTLDAPYSYHVIRRIRSITSVVIRRKN